MDSKDELEAFFAEQDERMTVSEADLRHFVARRASPIERVVPRQQGSSLHLNKISEGPSEISPALSKDSRQDATKKRHVELAPAMSTSTYRPQGTAADATVLSLNAAGARSKRIGENNLAGSSRVKKQRKTNEDRDRASDVEAEPKRSTDRLNIQESKVAPKKTCPLNETESSKPDPKSSRVVKKKETAAKQGDKVKTGSTRTQKPLAVEVPVAGSRYAQVLAKSGSSFLQDEIATRIAKLGQSSKPQPRVLKGAKRETLEGIEVSVSSASSAVSSRVSSPDLQTSGKESSKSRPISTKKSTASLTKKKNVQSDRMTPEKYALRILEQRRLEQENPPVKPKKAVPQFLRGKNIYYCGGEYENASDRTKKRLLLLDKFGANLQPKFDPECTTQIVVDSNVSLATLAAKMGYKSWKQIPESIPTLTWDWLTTSMDSANSAKDPEKVIKLPEYWENPAYHERFDAGSTVTKREASTSKGKQSDGLSASLRPRMSFKVNHDANDADSDSDKEENNAPSTSNGQDQALGEVGNNGPKLDADDPLAEFYAQAAAEHHERASFQSDVDDIGTDESDTDAEAEEAASVPKKPTGRRGFACDITDFQPKTCVNQDIVDKLSELAELHKAKPGEDNKWRAFTYSKAIRFLKSHDKPIKSYAQAVAIRGIGKKTAEKIQEIINTGELRRIGYENTDDVKVTRMFQGIYGVGQKIALTWYANGCRTLDDLKLGKCGVKLSEAQRIGLEHYDDINDRMPRTEAKALFDLIKPIALSIDPKLFVEIMGSYRRGKADCGDIDILITRCPDDGKTHAGILATLLQKLHDVGILTEDLALPENPWDLEGIYRGLCRLPNVVGSRHRRIDFLTVPWTSRGAALLYYTGDDIFNRAMRLKANHRGYSLNQKGLFEGVVRDPRNRTIKLNTGTLLASETEEEIFRILEVPYQEPHQRVRNFS